MDNDIKKCYVCASEVIENIVKTKVFNYKDSRISIPNYKLTHCNTCGEEFADSESRERFTSMLRHVQRSLKTQLKAPLRRYNFYDIFLMKNEVISPIIPVMVGSDTMGPGVSLEKGETFSGVDLFHYAGDDVVGHVENGIFIIKEFYQPSTSD